MPPKVPEGFGEFWFAEGDLINKLVDKYGEAVAIETIEAHRASYITDDDMALMAANGIEQVRLPIGWWAFADESYGTNASVVIADPAHADRKFVTIPTATLAATIDAFASHGLKVCCGTTSTSRATVFLLFGVPGRRSFRMERHTPRLHLDHRHRCCSTSTRTRAARPQARTTASSRRRPSSSSTRRSWRSATPSCNGFATS